MSVVEVALPDPGEGLASAEIIEWLVALGEPVAEDQPLVVVETDKAQVEIPAPVAGTVRELRADPGDTLDVGAVLASISTEATAPSPATAPEEPGASPACGPAHHGTTQGSGEAPARNRVLAAPATRRRARELGIDLASVTGTGPQGRITPVDLESAAEAPSAAESTAPSRAETADPAEATGLAAPSEGSPTVVPLRGLRRQVARSMSAAWQTPHITEFREVDAGALVRARRELHERAARRGGRLSYLPLLLAATVAALRAHPTLNARFDPDREEVHYSREVHLGLAVATDDGLLVPVMHHAERLGVRGLGETATRLASRARERSLTPEELAGGTFTVSNFGSFGTWLGTPLIRPPEVALVGFGRIRDAVVAEDGVPVVRPVLPVAAAADHRINDGSHLAAFLDTLTELAADPVLLLGEN